MPFTLPKRLDDPADDAISQSTTTAATNEPTHVSSSDVEQQPTPDSKTTTTEKVSMFQSLGLLDRFLALWILLAMAIGIILGNFVPNTGPALQRGKFVGVSIPIAIGLLVMMYPILCKIKFETLHLAFFPRSSRPEDGSMVDTNKEKGTSKRPSTIWTQIAFSIFLNWIIAPLFMLALSWAFLPDKPGLRNGLILVGLARCIAMVLIWNGLAGGDNEYCAILVAINSVLQMVLYAPLAILFLNIIGRSHGTGTSAAISYATVATSVAVFLGIPLAAALITRFSLRRVLAGPKWYDTVFIPYLSPLSLIGLLFTILILFASQGHAVVHQITSVLRVAAPLIVYFATIFTATFALAQGWFGFGYKLAATQSFTAASNNFELAIAVGVAMYGADSDEALACTVGPLIEVPVLLGLVYVVRWVGGRRGWVD